MRIRRYFAMLITAAVIVCACVIPSASTSLVVSGPLSASDELSERSIAPLAQAAAAESLLRWFRRLHQQVVSFVRALRWRSHLAIRTAPSDPIQQAVIDYLRVHDRVDAPVDLPPSLRRATCPSLWSRTFDHWLSPACGSGRDR